jgi:PAS domain S-box-containing protein
MSEHSAEHYRSLFEAMPHGLACGHVLVDGPAPHDFVFVEVNHAFTTLTGFHDVVGKKVSEVVPGIRETHAALLGRLSEVALDGAPARFEVHLRARDVWFSVAAHCSAPGHFVAMFEPTTEPWVAAARLAGERREHELILDSINVGIVMLVDRKQLWVNRWMEEFSGYTNAEMVGESTRMYYPSDEAFEEFGRVATRVMADGRPFETDVELRRKDGTAVWVKYNGRWVDPAYRSKGILAVVSDKTAQRHADEALRASEARFRNLFESHSAVMLLVDPRSGEVIDANPAAASFYGHERAVLRTMNIRAINLMSPEQVAHSMADAAQTKQNTFVFPHRLADGSVRTVEVSSSLVEVEGRRLLFSIVQDITERARAQQALQELNSSLEGRIKAAVGELRAKDRVLIAQSRQAAMGEMIGNIAHQWRQPLNALGLILSNLSDAARFDELDVVAVKEAVASSKRLIQSMSQTISDFGNFLRPDRERVRFSSRAQIGETCKLIEASLRGSSIRLAVEAGPDLTLLGFPNEYAQVLLNLIANAREAILAAHSEGGAGTITLRLSMRDGLGCVTVEDDGGGIRPDVLERIFEPYFSTKKNGTGIGLYMSRQIVQSSMGGRLEARNVPGGAAFDVLTPLAEAAPEPG